MYMYVRSCKSLSEKLQEPEREAEVEWGEIDETKLKKLKWDRTTDHEGL